MKQALHLPQLSAGPLGQLCGQLPGEWSRVVSLHAATVRRSGGMHGERMSGPFPS